MAIQSFAGEATEDLFHGKDSKKARQIPHDIHKVARRKLDMVNAATVLDDLRSPPSNNLEALHGDLAGLHSIRVNKQWRVIFRWTDAGPADVAIVDYH